LAAAPGAGPAEQADRQALLTAVAQAVDSLPHQQRAALVLRRYQDLSYADVAAALGCTQAAARANVYQALKKIRQAIGSW
jgi:RNA polymerase sigma factor (sigma-70 family)